jgi:hypothetical protein
MKKVVGIFFVFLFVVCSVSAQSRPPYNVSIYYYSNLSRSQFEAISYTGIQKALQDTNNIIYKQFWEIGTWDDEDDQMSDWVHENKILPGTRNNRENGDVWEMYVQRFEFDGWYILVRWSYDDGYTYRLFYYNSR